VKAIPVVIAVCFATNAFALSCKLKALLIGPGIFGVDIGIILFFWKQSPSE
jgi:hypothetical protein